MSEMGLDLRADDDPYRNLIRIYLPAGSPLSFMVFTNQDLRGRCNNTWKGDYYSTNNTQSVNDIISNSSASMQTYTSSKPFEGGQFNGIPNHTLFLTSPQLGTFRNLGPQGERDIIKKIIITANVNEVMTDQWLNVEDYIDVSRQTVRSLTFRLSDVYGNTINLHGSNFSFTLLFKSF
jgi:hypothetical protein